MKKWKWKIGCENELNFIAIWATKFLSILLKSRPISLKKGRENLLIQLNSLFLYYYYYIIILLFIIVIITLYKGTFLRA